MVIATVAASTTSGVASLRTESRAGRIRTARSAVYASSSTSVNSSHRRDFHMSLSSGSPSSRSLSASCAAAYSSSCSASAPADDARVALPRSLRFSVDGDMYFISPDS